ncbi:MAG: hypothetical protein L0G70_10380 [Rubrobacter sp.]|nr:hypothetical protein [Rubrobacter sp.]
MESAEDWSWSVVVVFVEVIAALVLSAILLEVYRILRRRKALSREALGMDLFLVIGSLVAVALWMRVLSQTMVG